MKKLFTLLFFITLCTYSQEDAWVYFTNKPDAAYYIANPLEMLSQKALDRRALHGVLIDEKDAPLHTQYVNAITASAGITVMAKSKWLNALHIRGSYEDITALNQLDFVASVEFADKTLNTSGRRAKANRTGAVTRIFEAQQDFNYGAATRQVEMLNGHLLHKADFTGEGITIAVLDAGFPGTDTSSLLGSLFADNRMLGGYNFVNRSENIYTGGSHGTMVLSTMAGSVEGQLVGTAPKASYYLFITEDVTSENPVEESYWVEAAEVADSLGADVINTSLGYFSYDNPAYSHTYEDMNGNTTFISRGASVAFTRGMFLVTSAGNSGAGANPHIAAPADAVNTLTLGAVNADEQYAAFSSIGPSADGRVKPDVMAMGQASAIGGTDGNVYTASGTSFSSPITAGLVACLWQALPNINNAQLLELIRQSADRYGNPDDFYGYGIPDFWKAYSSTLSAQSPVKESVVVYPNPADDKVYIDGANNMLPATFTLYNVLGQQVFANKTDGKGSIDVSAVPQGIYVFTVRSGNSQISGKLIKQ